MVRLRRLLPGLTPTLLAAWLAVPTYAEDAGALGRALAAASQRDWAGADRAARESGPIATDLILWQRLRAGQGTWPEYRDFAARNPDWPGLELFFRRGDALVTPNLPKADILAWFSRHQPTSMTAEVAYLSALDPATAATEALRVWRTVPMTAAEQVTFLTTRPDMLARAPERAAGLLDRGEWTAAELAVPLIPPGPDRALAEARIAVQARRSGIDAAINALPAAQRNDPGLAMDRFRWRVDAKQHDGARQLMLAQSTSADALRVPATWATMRVDYARMALRAGNWAQAEALAKNHFLPPDDRRYADLEWLAGYAALRAGGYDRALDHFAHLETVVDAPISASRAHYWQGRALEDAGRADDARKQYRQASLHQSAWYGQLAAEKIGVTMDPQLATLDGADSLPDWRGSDLRDRRIWQAALWLIAAGEPAQAQRFLSHMAETASAEDIGRMSRLMLEQHRPWDALRLAKAAAAKGAIYPATYFPLTGLHLSDLGVPPELVMSIARRESEFNHTVSSPVGALGLMQVMPDTARMMARRIGEPFEPARLTTDPSYNARLGAAYLDGLRTRFGPSIALVAAGYNAGPGRSDRWLRDFGDLRVAGKNSVDPVDWVEMIPFDETRNYVMRVAESLPVYRARIMGRPAPFVPTWDLRGGSAGPPPPSPLILVASKTPAPKPAPSAPVLQPASAGPQLGYADAPVMDTALAVADPVLAGAALPNGAPPGIPVPVGPGVTGAALAVQGAATR
ncbi:MAG: lytic transglycosylase [Paracoccus denitrificans]|nr:MAG: lytic transglycosylase [Paracoccus denitrificans]PZO83354.1 MAG: lytic transglycosylase [Paracoccus denitrificans]